MPTNTPKSHSADSLDTTAGWVYAVAVLVTLGSLAGGIVLIAHSIPSCSVNPFDATLTDCSGKTHPFVASGIGLLVGGLLQAFVIAVVARLCRVVAGMKAEAMGVQLRSARPYNPPAQTAFPYDPPGQ